MNVAVGAVAIRRSHHSDDSARRMEPAAIGRPNVPPIVDSTGVIEVRVETLSLSGLVAASRTNKPEKLDDFLESRSSQSL
jgi:hypothetical protein